MTSPAPCRAACRKAAMLMAYDSVLAPASSHGIASTPEAGSSRGNVTAATPSRRAGGSRAGSGLTVAETGGGGATFPATAVDQSHGPLVGGVGRPLPRCQVDRVSPGRRVRFGQVKQFGRVA